MKLNTYEFIYFSQTLQKYYTVQHRDLCMESVINVINTFFSYNIIYMYLVISDKNIFYSNCYNYKFSVSYHLSLLTCPTGKTFEGLTILFCLSSFSGILQDTQTFKNFSSASTLKVNVSFQVGFCNYHKQYQLI